ncbi:MAG: ABC transporter ATP-binding protein/permease [Deltaproteobacteria bacterium]|nr:ABC transporter ATP-binding protein/permease [Deltaproteobacteria bacterium]
MTDSTSEPTPAATPGAVPGTNKHFLRQVLRLAGQYWKCKRRAKVRSATLLLLLLTMGQVGLMVWVNYWNRALFDALEQRSIHGLLLQVGVFALIFVITIAVTAAHMIVKRWLMIDCRAWLTEQLVGSWMEDGRHYRLLFSAGNLDNPDQRIAEDIRIATESTIALAHSLVYCLMTIGLFIEILWSVSGAVVLPGTHVQVPGYMVPLAFGYAALGSTISWMIGRPLVRATNALQTAEATYRFGLSQARENTEAIALLRGEPMERASASARFGKIVREWNRQSLAYMGLVSFGSGYGALLPVFPILVAAPQYISGAMSLGVLMQAAQAFQRLTSALSWPVDNIGEIARCRASADRVLSLYEAMLQLDADAQAPSTQRIALGRSERARLVIEDLCITEPSGHILLENFSVDIRRGERVLIEGNPAVTGSLFKVIGGLWPWGSGRVWLPAKGNMLFVAQRPFLPEGTLRETLCYPHPPDAFPGPAIHHALECVGMAWLAPRMDERDNWEQVLPQRAQQRLGIARVLLQQPAWVFMEEATDAIDPRGERLILDMLRRELPNATLLNISLHPELRQLYQRTLILSRVHEAKVLLNGRHGNGGTH